MYLYFPDTPRTTLPMADVNKKVTGYI